MENKNSNPYKTFVNEVLGKAFESMGMKRHKRIPRKEKKRLKKWEKNAINNSWGRKAIIEHEKEMKHNRAIAEESFKGFISNEFDNFLKKKEQN